MGRHWFLRPVSIMRKTHPKCSLNNSPLRQRLNPNPKCQNIFHSKLITFSHNTLVQNWSKSTRQPSQHNRVNSVNSTQALYARSTLEVHEAYSRSETLGPNLHTRIVPFGSPNVRNNSFLNRLRAYYFGLLCPNADPSPK